MSKVIKRQKRRRNGKYSRKEIKDHTKGIICYCPQVCPDVMAVQLKYQMRKQPTGAGVRSVEDYVVRGNSPFDPDFAVGGQQAMGFDQWSNFYRRYRVKASKVKVLATADGAITCGFGIVPLNTSSAITDQSQIQEFQYCKQKTLGNDAATATGIMESYMSTAKIRGGPHDIVSYEQDLSSLVSGNPAQEWYWHVFGYGLGGSSNNFDVVLEIIITYYVEFYDRETLIRS